MRTLGPYVLTRRLGAGGMGEVWMAQRTSMGVAKLVAVKTLLPARAQDPKWRKLFLDEARLSMLLTNSNVVQVFEVDEAEDGTCYMAMEWVDGISLTQLLEHSVARGEPLPLAIIAFIIGELLKALAYAHQLEHGGEQLTIVHRDVSPHNVMLSSCGEVKLMDFGIARVASEETSGAHIKGKLRYMPPEQLRGQSREPTIDLFAVGAMLHELLDGRKFRGDVVDETRLYGMILDGEVPPLQREPGTIPAEIEQLRTELLAVDPRARLGSARAAYRQLTTWPGYRDARFELEELVRRCRPPQEATSTLVLPPMEGFERGSTSRSRGHRTAALAQSEAGSTAVERRGAQRSDSRRTRPLVLGLSLASLGFGALGMAMLLRPREQAADTSVEPAQPQHAAPASVPSASEVSEDEPTPETTPAVSPELLGETQPSSEPPPVMPEVEPHVVEAPTSPPERRPEVERERKSSKSRASKRTPVKLEASRNQYWVAVRIGGKELVIDRLTSNSASTKLAPGDYAVSYREDPTAAWRSAGTVTIPAHGSATLVLHNGQASVK